MQKALMTAQEYADNTTLLKTLFVDLDITDLSPDTINAKICEVQNNFNKVGRLAIDSINNLHLARTMVDANKLNKELMHSSSMLATAVSSLKSSDLREAQAANMSAGSARDLRAASEDKLLAEAYHLSVMFVHGNLDKSVDVLREKIKLFQSMLYLDPTGHR